MKGIADPTDGDVPGVWYLPYPQNPAFLTDDVTFVVHSRVPVATLERPVRQVLDGVDPTLAPYDFTTVDRMTGNTYVQDRFASLLIMRRLLASQLHGVQATDPLSYAVASIVLGVAAGLASWFPANRAARVEPMVALRSE